MFLRHSRTKEGKDHTYWSLVETIRTPDGPRQRTLCYLGELNSSAQARWWKTVEVFNDQGETQQLKLFPSHVKPPADDPQVARVLLNQVRLERTRQFGACWLGLELWRRLELDRFLEATVDHEAADVPWSRVAALLAINRLCAPGSELAIEQRWYPSTALDDLLDIADREEFPNWDDNLRQAFRHETELFFQSIVREDRSVIDLLNADYTFVNERLARHYGIPNVYGSQFPARAPHRRKPPRPARARKHSHRDLLSQPQFSRAARQMDFGEHPGAADAHRAAA